MSNDEDWVKGVETIRGMGLEESLEHVRTIREHLRAAFQWCSAWSDLVPMWGRVSDALRLIEAEFERRLAEAEADKITMEEDEAEDGGGEKVIWPAGFREGEEE